MPAKYFTTDRLLNVLNDEEQAAAWLATVGITDVQSAHRALEALAGGGVPIQLLANFCSHLHEQLPTIGDPDMALANLIAFIQASRSPLSILSLVERDEDALPILLQIFSNSQHQSDILIREPESYDLLRLTDGEPVSRRALLEELVSEADVIDDLKIILKLLHRFKQRETLRIAYGDLVRNQRVDTVTRQISHVADAILNAAVLVVDRSLSAQYGIPRSTDRTTSRFVVIGLAKLGGVELNYSGDINLMFLYESDGHTDGPKTIANKDYFEQLSSGVVHLLTETTDLGSLYLVDLRMRPTGEHGPLAVNAERALRHYDVQGRTWERQALVKARPVAGDLDFGERWLGKLESWVYRRYLTRAEIGSIKALKQRIERRAIRDGADQRDIHNGCGGIRDIEFVIQFLQLLNGGDAPDIRVGNTLEAIARLAQAGSLTLQEQSILDENYRFLRRIEHRMQILLDMNTHSLPDDSNELSKLALRLGFEDTEFETALAGFQRMLSETTTLNRKILDHLLGDAFTGEEEVAPEVDLVLDPDPREESIREVLRPYSFRQPIKAYAQLMELANESIPFLSSTRCRHFLAAICRDLLTTVAKTPNCDETLDNISRVSGSLGGKGVLWELFSTNPSLMEMYVRLCAASPYLSSILISHPGMIDELMDSLVLDRTASLNSLRTALSDLCRGAKDLDVILQSFKTARHLRVGVRDLVGKVDAKSLMRALSDIAEVCVCQIVRGEYQALADKFGYPRRELELPDVAYTGPSAHTGPSADTGQPACLHSIDVNEDQCDLAVLCTGKFGGRELSYHSDIEISLIYESDGTTQHSGRGSEGKKTTTNQHFFNELARKVSKALNHRGAHGRLYDTRCNWRATDRSECESVSISRLEGHFRAGDAALPEYIALCTARPIFGSAAFCQRLMATVKESIQARSCDDDMSEIQQLREGLESSCSPQNLKRGWGGRMDIELIVRFLQLRHANDNPDLFQIGTVDVLDHLRQLGHLSRDEADVLSQSYEFIRRIESRLGLMNLTARHDLPGDLDELNKLAFLSGCRDGQSLADQCRQVMKTTRQQFVKHFSPALA